MAGKDIAKKIEALGCACGITGQYWDNFGVRHHTSQATYRQLLSAMRVPWADPEDLARELARRRLGPWGALLEPVQLIAPVPAAATATARVWSPSPAPPDAVEVQGEMISEHGTRYHWETRLQPEGDPKSHAVPEGFRAAVAVPLPANLEMGYYELTLRVRGGGREETGRSRLIAAPPRAYIPDWLEQGQRCWGLNLPLYAVKSRTNWGMGDFADLQEIMRWAGSLGAAFVGVNPLHAAGGQAGDDPSPYSPLSRVFRNTLYLSLESAPEMAACREARELLASPEFQAAKARLAAAALVDYQEVCRLKRRVLEWLYRTFCQVHGTPEEARTPRGLEFAEFVAAGGESLAGFGQFRALADFFQDRDWRRWPEPYQDPRSPAVAEFAREHRREVALFQYGQWLAESQLDGVCREAREQGLPFSLYEDLALGAGPGGFDTWAHQDLFARDCAIGAPPDAFNPQGQNWGLPPLIPDRLRAAGYQLFIDTLRANLPVGGLLRLDHVMGLFRLLWIPQGVAAAQGAYVNYPNRELLAILALESVRRRALIIGEDLGTVPPHIRRDLGRTGVFSYRVFYFERDGHHRFQPPEVYPPQALATVTTHDLPTLTGFWQGDDLALKRRLHLYPEGELAEADAEGRARDRRLLVEALQQRGLLAAGPDPEATESCPADLRAAALTYLAQSESSLMEVRLEEIFGVAEQQNLPGTTSERPNWRIKLPLSLEDMEQSPEPARIAARLNHARKR
ncbi:MAG: 4-alpha-glucanotransferase [Syntrophobacterales bacterium]|jgi:4-alpha-glucanotransferase|nr:4-alpha-glucanotransferase [Syntrophobacterales bacterium]